MMSKDKIIRGLEDHLTNTFCSKVDMELDPNMPKEIKEQAVKRLTLEYNELLEIRHRLRQILIG